jgi:phosphate starvation-inducible protein PhoH
MFLTGDVRQTDIKGVNGLSDLLEKLKFKNVQGIEIVEFNATHVEREEVVKEVLNLYGQE